MNGGEGGIRTHVPVARQDAFEAPPLRPLRYLSVCDLYSRDLQLYIASCTRAYCLAPLSPPSPLCSLCRMSRSPRSVVINQPWTPTATACKVLCCGSRAATRTRFTRCN